VAKIQQVHGRQIYDSRGNPTIEVDVVLQDGTTGRAAVPSGASTGRYEAVELRDGGKPFGGKGVRQALANVDGEICAALRDLEADDQQAVDRRLIELDGTPNKSRLGANAVLGASLAVARAAAHSHHLPLHRYLAKADQEMSLPVPLLNVLNGGRHADNRLEIQEFLIVPHGFDSFQEALAAGVEVYQALRRELMLIGQRTAVGDEGGFAPDLSDDEEALQLLLQAVERAGFQPGDQVSLALDPAASEMRQADGYRLSGSTISAKALIAQYATWSRRFPLVSIEDPMDEDDTLGWQAVTAELGGQLQLIGDDNFVTNAERLRQGAQDHIANAILIKPNQVGTLSETMSTITAARQLGYRSVVSHRSGDTEDTFIADLTVATGAGQIKTGAPCRQERLAKYNRLLRIAEQAPDLAYAGRLVFG
jgi:enolase